MNERLTEIETELAHQSQTVEVLNQVILELRDEIKRLQRDFNALQERVDSSQLPYGPAGEKPPHY